jgi:hypothetical protein
MNMRKADFCELRLMRVDLFPVGRLRYFVTHLIYAMLTAESDMASISSKQCALRLCSTKSLYGSFPLNALVHNAVTDSLVVSMIWDAQCRLQVTKPGFPLTQKHDAWRPAATKRPTQNLAQWNPLSGVRKFNYSPRWIVIPHMVKHLWRMIYVIFSDRTPGHLM